MIFTTAGDERALAPLYAGGWDAPREVRERVAAILAEVRAHGDAALVAYTRRFDYADATAATLPVDVPSRLHARGLVPEQIATGLELARERIADFHERQKPVDIRYRTDDATAYAFLARPLASIGAYVPGGSASLPSTVLMTVVPAKVAGVERVVVIDPAAARRDDRPRDPVRLQPVRRRRALCGRRRAGRCGAGLRHGDDRAGR